MAAFEHTSTSGFAGRVGQPIFAVVARFIDWNEKRRTRNALAMLSDRELDDIGLSRSDVYAIR
ncbi:DUF1127 domain-containing protein [uncultured Shimia sp.]|uniref:DUF1127 domain-containing protein n=1 Tax=uncultured Shimia sp. TaxID=573152 RepID=UPI002627CC89|nr:DUF1127 domain-containing protein [uncultured Shimia sp.]